MYTKEKYEFSKIYLAEYCHFEQCDDVLILYDTYTKTCMKDRNKFMVQHSSVVIACFNGKPSGTGNTIRFTKENGCNIRILNPDKYK